MEKNLDLRNIEIDLNDLIHDSLRSNNPSSHEESDLENTNLTGKKRMLSYQSLDFWGCHSRNI